ncbi:MAG: 3-phosphoshikimate 1-carboxyvinyltransferase [Rhodospirillaceae bacterium]|nr:MAG: 3-phosphoshikimate 1-carboxyvinyltransferase [Rhodospirillaceae bacterium]
MPNMSARLTSFRTDVFGGTLRVPGDKSISHRALMLGAMAVGETTITGLLEGEDVLHTAAALRALGAAVMRDASGCWRVLGRGIGGLVEPADVLDMGNAGTGARLLLGLLATHPFTSVVTGDASLRTRPMQRVMEPLRRIGARFLSRAGGRLPLAVAGTASPVPIVYTLPVASAQVKSAVLLAALNTPGATTVIEPAPSRDHTERMLQEFGVTMRAETDPATGAKSITLIGQPEISGRAVSVPADPSSAALAAVAALLVPGGGVTLTGVGVNPLRYGVYETLREMGGSVEKHHERMESGEPVADIVIRHGALTGIDVPAARAPAMIDEYPVLAIAAACAHGITRLHGLAELRVKESDRLVAIARGLSACGGQVAVEGDTLIIHGSGGPPPGGARVVSAFDHRIAMAFLVLGMVTGAPVTVDDAQAIATSFPGFVSLMNDAGARIGNHEGEDSEPSSVFC